MTAYQFCVVLLTVRQIAWPHLSVHGLGSSFNCSRHERHCAIESIGSKASFSLSFYSLAFSRHLFSVFFDSYNESFSCMVFYSSSQTVYFSVCNLSAMSLAWPISFIASFFSCLWCNTASIFSWICVSWNLIFFLFASASAFNASICYFWYWFSCRMPLALLSSSSSWSYNSVLLSSSSWIFS